MLGFNEVLYTLRSIMMKVEKFRVDKHMNFNILLEY